MELELFDAPLEVKEVSDDGAFVGYASVFNNTDSYADIVLPGAFKRTLREHRKAKTMPKLLWQHMSAYVPGLWQNLEEDEAGLLSEGKLLLDTQLGRETHILLKARAIDGLSIGYVTRKSEMDEETGIRRLKDVDLWEASIVTFPANTAARISAVKNFAGHIKTIREFEDFLRDVGGFSHAQAKAIASRGFKPTDSRDGDEGMKELAELIQRNINILRGV